MFDRNCGKLDNIHLPEDLRGNVLCTEGGGYRGGSPTAVQA